MQRLAVAVLRGEAVELRKDGRSLRAIADEDALLLTDALPTGYFAAGRADLQ